MENCYNNGQPCNTVVFITTFNLVDEDLLNMRECLNEILDHENESVRSPCPRRILRVVAKLRAKRFSTDEVQRWAKEDMDQFCRAGGLESLVNLLTSGNSQSIQMQALKNLGILANNEEIKKKICSDNPSCPGTVELIGGLVASSSGDVQTEAVALMRALMRNNSLFDVKKASQPGTLTALLKLVCSASCIQVQTDVLGILWEFSVLEYNRCRIANGHINGSSEVFIEKLVQLCISPSPAVEFCAAALLQNLCIDKDVKAKVSATPGVSESLLSLIESFDRDRLMAVPRIQLIKRVENSSCSAILIGWAVSMLDSDNEIHQIRGLDVLQGFSESLLELGASEGAISRVVHLLDSGSTTVVEKASEALYRFSMPEENEVRIASNPIAIQRLITLLEADCSTVRGNSVKVLGSISFNPINKEKILNENRSLQKVAALLFHESFAAQSSAASLLWNLSNTTIENKIRIASIHGVPQRLSDLLLSESPLVQEKAAGAIMSLSYNGRSRKMIASIACTFERLVKLLDSVSALVHQNAAGALYNLSISPDNIATIGAHPRAVANLVCLLSSNCALVQEYAAGALGNLALLEEMREDMKQMDAT